ncbi:MAG: hypothetical protein FJ137_04140 [Deltaproteobacteria bacterium]|nr:hypothetical protein [Deltaproteobacteria bacterium]
MAVDVVAPTLLGGALHVALYRRADHPAKGRHVLPGALFVFDHYVRHEGAVVSAGEKTVLRSDVMYRRAGAGA